LYMKSPVEIKASFEVSPGGLVEPTNERQTSSRRSDHDETAHSSGILRLICDLRHSLRRASHGRPSRSDA